MYKVKRFSSEEKKTKLEKNAKGAAVAGTALGALAAKDAVSAANSLRKTGANAQELKAAVTPLRNIVSNSSLGDLRNAAKDNLAKHGKGSVDALASDAAYKLKRASNRAKGAGAALLAAGTIYGIDRARKYMKGRKEAGSEQPMA